MNDFTITWDLFDSLSWLAFTVDIFRPQIFNRSHTSASLSSMSITFHSNLSPSCTANFDSLLESAERTGSSFQSMNSKGPYNDTAFTTSVSSVQMFAAAVFIPRLDSRFALATLWVDLVSDEFYTALMSLLAAFVLSQMRLWTALMPARALLVEPTSLRVWHELKRGSATYPPTPAVAVQTFDWSGTGAAYDTCSMEAYTIVIDKFVENLLYFAELLVTFSSNFSGHRAFAFSTNNLNLSLAFTSFASPTDNLSLPDTLSTTHFQYSCFRANNLNCSPFHFPDNLLFVDETIFRNKERFGFDQSIECTDSDPFAEVLVAVFHLSVLWFTADSGFSNHLRFTLAITDKILYDSNNLATRFFVFHYVTTRLANYKWLRIAVDVFGENFFAW